MFSLSNGSTCKSQHYQQQQQINDKNNNKNNNSRTKTHSSSITNTTSNTIVLDTNSICDTVASTRESCNNNKRASRASGHYQHKHNKQNTTNHNLYLHKTPSRAYHYLRRTEVEEEPSRSPEQEMTVFDEHREIEQVLDCVKKVRYLFLLFSKGILK